MADEFTAHRKAKNKAQRSNNLIDPETWELLYKYLDQHIHDYDLEGATSEVVDLILEHMDQILELWDPNR